MRTEQRLTIAVEELRTLPERVRRYRGARGLGQRAAAAEIGVSNSYLSDVETRVCVPTVDRAILFLAWLGAQPAPQDPPVTPRQRWVLATLAEWEQSGGQCWLRADTARIYGLLVPNRPGPPPFTRAGGVNNATVHALELAGLVTIGGVEYAHLATGPYSRPIYYGRRIALAHGQPATGYLDSPETP